MIRERRQGITLFRWHLFEPFREHMTAGFTGKEEDRPEAFNLGFPPETGVSCLPGSSAPLPPEPPLSEKTEQDPAPAFLQNRRTLCRAAGEPFDSFTCSRQVHGDRALWVTAEDAGAGRDARRTALPEADALLTQDPGVFLNGLTADCLSLVFYDPVTRSGGVCHAGWRGSVADIAGKSLRLLQTRAGVRPENLRVGLGPAIGFCCFQTGEEVVEQFQAHPVYRPAFHRRENGRSYLNLPAFNRALLLRRGLLPEHIETAPFCTRCSGDFFSYRNNRDPRRITAFFALKSGKDENAEGEDGK